MREWVEERDRWPVPDGADANGDRGNGELSPAAEPDATSDSGSVATRVRASLGSATPPHSRGRVLLGIRDVAFHQEVLDHLGRDARLEVVGAVARPGALLQGMRDLAPDVTVACPVMVREISHPAVGRAPNLLVVAEEMTVPVLREAIEAGAHGVFAWPEEREELSEEIARLRRPSSEVPAPRGRVIAVYGARGGSGTTFVASHLAASFADRGETCVLVDLDANFADITIALGIDRQVRTIADLVPVAGELGPHQVEDALYRHPRGFSVLLAPTEPAHEEPIPPGLYTAAIALLAGAFEVVVVHVARGLDSLIRNAIGMADEVVLVIAPDLFSLHSARRMVRALGLREPPGRCRVLINPLVRNEIGPRDVERVLGMAPFAAVRFDPAVGRAQGHGRLLPHRARRAGKDVLALAGMLSPRRALHPEGEVS
jgi:Flp pilus assembly CpaE family ATPase